MANTVAPELLEAFNNVIRIPRANDTPDLGAEGARSSPYVVWTTWRSADWVLRYSYS